MTDDDPDGPEGGSGSDDAAADPDATERPEAEQEDTAEPNWGEPVDSEPAEPTDSEEPDRDDPAPNDDAPLSDLARRMDRQRRDQTDADSTEPTSDFDTELSDAPPAPDDDPFEEMSVGEIDEETLWSSLGDDEAGVGVGTETTSDADIGSIGDVDPVSEVESVGGAGPGAREHVVPKDKYCQSCPHFAEPPELACTHDGTEIVEVVDSERFRVRNCPMVESGVEPKK